MMCLLLYGSPPRHMQVRARNDDLLTTSIDGALIWDGKKLHRRRALGSGPYGILQAAYTGELQSHDMGHIMYF